MSLLRKRVDNLTPEQGELLDALLADRGVTTVGNAADVRTGVPLSFTQQRLWNSGALAPDTAYGNLPVVLRLQGPVDDGRLERALQEVVRRQAMLRTVFTTKGGAIHQVPLADWTPHLERVSLQPIPAPERLDEARRLAQAVALRPFAFTEEPLFRAALFRLEDRDYVLTLVTHHLAADGWGVRILLGEIAAHYQSGGAAGALPQGLQYAEYASLQRAGLEKDGAAAQLEYWRRRLADAPRHLPLPLDRPPPSRPSFAVDALAVEIHRGDATALRRIGQAEGVTLYTAVLAAWIGLLHRMTGQDDVIVGSIISSRNRREVENTVGNFGTNVFLRVNFSDRPDFRTLLGRVHELLLEAHVHQDVPVEWLLDARAPSGPGRLPLFHVLCLLRDGPLDRHLNLPGVGVEAMIVPTGLSTLDLNLDLTENGATITGFLEYKTALFDRETAVLLRDAFVETVAAVVRDLGTYPADLRLPERLLVGRARSVRPSSMDRPRDGVLGTAAERLVGAVWREVLKLEHVGPYDSFFDLGGDSLLAMVVIDRIERETGHRLHPLDLGTMTLRQIAALSLARGGEPQHPDRQSVLGQAASVAMPVDETS